MDSLRALAAITALAGGCALGDHAPPYRFDDWCDGVVIERIESIDYEYPDTGACFQECAGSDDCGPGAECANYWPADTGVCAPSCERHADCAADELCYCVGSKVECDTNRGHACLPGGHNGTGR